MSDKWEAANKSMDPQMPKNGKKWNVLLIQVRLHMHHEIWKSQNESIHGKTKEEAKIRAIAGLDTMTKASTKSNHFH
jgi:hypothetical protein